MNSARFTPPADWSATPRQVSTAEIDAYLDQLDQQATTVESTEVFYAELLELSAEVLGANSAEHWRIGIEGLAICTGRSIREHGVQDLKAPDVEDSQQVAAVCFEGEARWVVSCSTAVPTIVCPIRRSKRIVGAIVYRFNKTTKHEEPNPFLAIAIAVAEVAERFELNQLPTDLAPTANMQTATLSSIDAFAMRLHASNSTKGVTRLIAEGIRNWTEADRVSVLSRRGSGWLVEAVSGVQTPSHRSDAVRRMERLTTHAMVVGERLAVEDAGVQLTPASEVPPQLQQTLDDYLEATGARRLVVAACRVPESEDQSAQAKLAVVVERFDGTMLNERMTSLETPLETLLQHAAVAHRRANQSRLLARLMAGGSQLQKFGLIAAAALILGMVLLWWPETLTIPVEGRFVPQQQARVFASLDGLVEEVLVQHADRVVRGQPLLRMRSPELEIEIEKTFAAIATTQQEIESLQTAKLRGRLAGATESTDASTISSRIAGLEEQRTHQLKRKALLDEQATRLVVTSPIAGQVLSWRPEGTLADRPVQRGQRLLEVAATEGPWQIEIEAPDYRVGPLLEAYQLVEGKEPQALPVRYVVKSDPALEHRGVVSKIATATSTNATGESVVRIRVDPSEAAAARPRSGLVVSAKIECGQYSLGYVWFHEAWQAIQRCWF